MSDFHLEALWDRIDELTEGEREQLERHVESCPACRVTWRMHQQASAQPEDGAMFERVFAHLERRTPTKKHRAPRLVALATASLLGAGVAAAAVPVVQRALEEALRQAPPRAPVPRPAHKNPDSEAQVAPAPRTHRLQPPPSLVPPEASPKPTLRLGRRRSTRSPNETPLTETELFRRANTARRAGQPVVALRLYRELHRRFPKSRRTHTSRVSVGRLLLERRPAGALGAFDTYLSRGGPLAEQALVGRAQALTRLGRAEAARAAWEQLLREFPHSLHAAQARRALDR